jgi:hypothetical protein
MHRYTDRQLTMRDMYLALLALITLYWLANEFVRPALLNDLLDGALICLCIVVTAQYATRTLTYTGAVADRAAVIRFGIVLSWFGTGAWRLDRFLLQEGAFGYTGPIGLHDPIRGFMMVVLILGAAYHILAFGMDKPGLPNLKAVGLVFGSCVVGFASVGALRTFS